MFYLDGLFVSQSNVVAPVTPSRVLLLGQACRRARRQALRVKECGCKMYLGYSGSGQ